jgi:galactokinase
VCGDQPDLIVRAPGRVNLIGEHTDYNDGFVMPAAIGVQTLAAVRLRRDPIIRVIAADFENAVSEFALDMAIAPDPAQPWADYVRGMVAAMLASGHALTGADLAIAGNIPKGSGLSSSASVAVAVGTALNMLNGLELTALQVAQYAQAAECDFVGTKCGIMDQLASAAGQSGHALLIDCRSLAITPIALPPEMGLLIVQSGVTRGLVEGEYNLRRRQCEAAAAALGVPALRDADPAMLAEAKTHLEPIAFARARHVVTENQRTRDAAVALRAGDLRALGALMAQSHASLRDDFEVSLPIIDDLVTMLQSEIGAEGGARMTGGGFGGAVVAVAMQDRIDAIAAAIGNRYRTPDGTPSLIMREQASAGAAMLG